MKKQLLKKLSASLHRFRCSFSGAKPTGIAFIVTTLMFSARAKAPILAT